jgi:quinol-cytochrome oxidoreductase complex cytochrome b subunit
MGADYKKQYRPEELEPFWPNEIVKMSVVVLCTFALIMFLAVLPELLDAIGLHGFGHHEEPADPRGSTPAGIKPEWYFLAVYQYLRLMPTQLLGISGKTLGVLGQGVGVMVLVLLPFWYRKQANRRPSWVYRIAVTAAILGFAGLTLWGGWPDRIEGGEEHLVPLRQYMREHPLFFILMGATLLVFYVLIYVERQGIRRVLGDSAPRQTEQEDGQP